MLSQHLFGRNAFALAISSILLSGAIPAFGQGVPVSSGLLVRYAFAGNNRDSSMNHNDLDTGGVYQDDRFTRPDQSIFCNGATLKRSQQGLGITRDFSCAAWVKLGQLPASGELRAIANVEPSGFQPNLYFTLGISGDSGVGFRFESGGNGQPFVRYPIDNNFVDTWNHIAVVRKNDTVRLYVNSILRDFAQVTTGDVDGMNNPLSVGGSALLSIGGLGGYFVGNIDELRIYNRPLTKAEVDTLADSANTVHVAVARRITPVQKMEVWTAEEFRSRFPEARLYSLTGAVADARSLAVGHYLWLDGNRKRRVVIQ